MTERKQTSWERRGWSVPLGAKPGRASGSDWGHARGFPRYVSEHLAITQCHHSHAQEQPEIAPGAQHGEQQRAAGIAQH